MLYKTILLVEDQLLLAMAEEMMLSNYNYRVIKANSGRQAIKIVDERPDIDLILMDINLGEGIDGTEAARKILNKHDLPLIFMSSHTEREVVERTEGITSYGYIVKDSGETVMLASIKMAFKLFEAKQQLKAANDKLAATIHALPDLLFEVGLDGTFRYFHAPHPEMLFVQPSEILGNKLDAVLPSHAVKVIREAMAHADISGRSLSYPFQLEMQGSILWFEISVSRNDNNPADPHFMVLSRDITQRKKIEQSLQGQKFAMDEHSIVAATDVNGTITYANDKFCELSKYSREELIGKNHRIINSGYHSREFFIKLYKTIYAGNVWKGDIRNKAKDGTFYWVTTTIVPQLDGNGDIQEFITIRTDITEQKKSEDFLRERSDFLKELGKNVSSMLAYWTKDLTCAFANAAYREWFGRTEEEMVGVNLKEVLGDQLFNANKNYIEACLKGEKQEFERAIEKPDGEVGHTLARYIPHIRDGEVVGFFAVVTDVTLIKATEVPEQITLDKDIIESIDALSTHIAILDEEGIVLKVNKAWRDFAIVNSNPNSVKHSFEGTNYVEVCGSAKGEWSEEAESMVAGIKSVINGTCSEFKLEYPCHSPNEQRWFIAKVTRFLSRGKIRVAVAHENITKRKLAENKVTSLLKDKEIILKEVHHRMKNNIANVEALLFLQMNSSKNPETVSSLQAALNRVKSMRLLYNKLLMTDDYQLLSTKEYLTSLTDMLVELAPENLKLSLTNQIQDFQMSSTKLFTLGVMLNELVTNVVKYAFVDRTSGNLEISMTCDENKVTLTVRDDGKGLPKNFDMAKSNGFGLMLTKMMSQQNGGSFTMKNHIGTTAIVEFPV